MTGRYELNKSPNGQYHFVLKAANTFTILTSEQYESKAAAQNGIASVQSHCASEDRYERKVAVDKRFYFTLRAVNNHVIGTSQMYTTEQAREVGIASVKTNGATKDIDDNT
jgi:uncharacterized protein YegP (UPF0339 family)